MEPADIVTDIPGLDDPQRRVLGATYGDLRFINLYVPNGSEVGSEKYQYKLDWLEKLHTYIERAMEAGISGAAITLAPTYYTWEQFQKEHGISQEHQHGQM